MFVLILGLLAGCATNGQVNPSFSISVHDANDAMREMRDHPKPLDRPLLIVGGWANTSLMTTRLAGAIRGIATDNAQIAHVSLLTCTSFESCRKRLIEVVDEEFGRGEEAGDQSETVEVDVIAYSMGGLAARYAAAPRLDDERRLKIRRLFTISTPHRGAQMAPMARFERRASDMLPGSAFLAVLDGVLPDADYEITAYARLGDLIVGPMNCAPPGCALWWVPNRPFELSHHDAFRDPRILGDIARRLRGETPFTRQPASPLPGHDSSGAAAHSVQ